MSAGTHPARIMTKVARNADGEWIAVVEFYAGEESISTDPLTAPPEETMIGAVEIGPFATKAEAEADLRGKIRGAVTEAVQRMKRAGALSVGHAYFGGRRVDPDTLDET